MSPIQNIMLLTMNVYKMHLLICHYNNQLMERHLVQVVSQLIERVVLDEKMVKANKIKDINIKE